MVDTFLKIFMVILNMFKWPLIIIFAIIGFFYISCMFWFIVKFFKGERVHRGSVKKIKKRSALMRILYDAPRQYVEDLYNMKPDFFRPQGLVVFTGRQGSGKTSAAMRNRAA